jgi:uncharacterized delta-60 repeat protein
MKALIIVFITILVYISQSFSIGQEWVARYNGTANSADWGYAITSDLAGNIYVTGYSTGSGTGKDYRTIKYDIQGNVLWTQSFNGPANGGDYSNALFVDGAGNVYVTGRVDYGTPLSDIVTIKYNTNGVQQWMARYSGAANGVDEGKSIYVDASGNVYVGGKTFGTASSYDFIAIKYNSSGAEQWVSVYNGPGNNEDIVNSLAVDASGSVFLAGSSIGAGTGSDFAIVKFNSDGSNGWVKRHNGPANGGDAAVSVKIDGLGNIIGGGYTDKGVSSTRYDFIVVKYSTDGTEQWSKFYNGTGSVINDFLTAMTLDANNNIYVTGASGGFPSGFADSNYATIKYNSSGELQWVATYSGPNNSIDVSRAIFVDNSQNVYITGTSFGGSSDDYVSIKYNPNGTTAWIMSYNGPAGQSDYSTSIIADNSGNAFVTGRSMGSGTDFDYATIKYGDLVGINPVSANIPQSFNLYQNYPNPFNPTTKIRFDIPEKTNAGLVVYNNIGQLVVKEDLGNLSPGVYEYTLSAANLSSGVYFYTLNANQFIQTKKMILIK